MITVITPPVVEPISVGDVLTHLRLDESNQEPPPSIITAALASMSVIGNVDNGAHRYISTFVTADGETQGGAVSASVIVTDNTVNGKIELTGITLGGAIVTARRLYRTAAGGSVFLFLAEIANNTDTAYTDNIADASLGASAPSSNTTSDPLIKLFITAVRKKAELELHRYLCTQTLEASFHEFPHKGDRFFYLPPLNSVVSIKYIDIHGVEQTLAATQYYVDGVSKPARIEEAYGVVWPSVREQMNAITIRFVSGYGAAIDVPACIKTWMLMMVNTMWETRTQFVIGTSRAAIAQVPNQYINAMIDSERVTGRI